MSNMTTKVWEVSEHKACWVREHCLVEAPSEAEALEAYERGDIIDYLPDRDYILCHIEDFPGPCSVSSICIFEEVDNDSTNDQRTAT